MSRFLKPFRSIVWIVLDSARWDAFQAARTPWARRLGRVEKRHSYASWTAPSHQVFLSGLLPHANKPGIAAARVYREELARWGARMGARDPVSLDFDALLPAMSLARLLRAHGYRCEARVSLPVLNPSTGMGRDFDHWELMPSHHDLPAIVRALRFDAAPVFHFVNTGETHYPYLTPGDTTSDLPWLPGLRGACRDLAAGADAVANAAALDSRLLSSLFDRQVACVESVDASLEALFEKAPDDTWFILTSDHGELFGEDGWFGHGPIVHEKVFEVFLVEGVRP